MRIIGRDGITLDEYWERFGGRAAYKTTAMAGFPNLFLLNGPNAGFAHTSALFSIENIVDLIIRVAQPVLLRQKDTVEIKLVNEVQYNRKLQDALEDRVWQGCRSYYRDERGRNTVLYPWSSYMMYLQTQFECSEAWIYL